LECTKGKDNKTGDGPRSEKNYEKKGSTSSFLKAAEKMFLYEMGITVRKNGKD